MSVRLVSLEGASTRSRLVPSHGRHCANLLNLFHADKLVTKLHNHLPLSLGCELLMRPFMRHVRLPSAE